MPKGLKSTSSPIQISGDIQATTAPGGVFVAKSVDLQLNALDNEVFVVTGLKIDFDNANLEPNVGLGPGILECTQRASISSTPLTAFAGVENSQVIGAAGVFMLADTNTGALAITSENAMDAPPATQDYLHIIATNDFHINYFVNEFYINGATPTVSFRLYGYRAQADASTYAALVQSELLSA